MKKYSNLLINIIVFTLITLSIAGCWNRKELDTIAIVSGTAIDKAKEPDKLKLTAQIIKVGAVPTPQSGGGVSSANPFWNLKETGTTVFEIVRKMINKSDRKLYWPHNQVIIFSQDIAKDGVEKYVDFFVRDAEPRLSAWILVSQSKASEVLDFPSGLEDLPSMYITETVKNQRSSSQAPQITLHDFLTRLMSKTTAPIAPLITLTSKEKEKQINISGTAVFKKDKMVGVLNTKETRGLLWVIGKVKSGIIVVDCPQGNGKASLEIIRASSKITPEIKNDQIHITVKIKEEGNLGSQMCPEDLTTPAAWTSLEKRQATAIRNEVLAAIKKAQEFNTDIFGFGDAVHRKYPKLWKEIENQWNDFFPTLEVSVIVEAKLRRTGLIAKPPGAE